MSAISVRSNSHGEEIFEEEDVEFMYSHIAPCKGKPLAEADSGNNSQEDQADADSFAPTELRTRCEREVPA